MHELSYKNLSSSSMGHSTKNNIYYVFLQLVTILLTNAEVSFLSLSLSLNPNMNQITVTAQNLWNSEFFYHCRSREAALI